MKPTMKCDFAALGRKLENLRDETIRIKFQKQNQIIHTAIYHIIHGNLTIFHSEYFNPEAVKTIISNQNRLIVVKASIPCGTSSFLLRGDIECLTFYKNRHLKCEEKSLCSIEN